MCGHCCLATNTIYGQVIYTHGYLSLQGLEQKYYTLVLKLLQYHIPLKYHTALIHVGAIYYIIVC